MQEADYENAAALLEQLKSPLKVAAPRLGTSRMERGTRGEECERERVRVEEQIADCAKRGDYKGAAALQEQREASLLSAAPSLEVGMTMKGARAEEFERRRQRIEEQIQDCVRKNDYKTAADLQEQMENWRTMSVPRTEADMKKGKRESGGTHASPARARGADCSLC